VWVVSAARQQPPFPSPALRSLHTAVEVVLDLSDLPTFSPFNSLSRPHLANDEAHALRHGYVCSESTSASLRPETKQPKTIVERLKRLEVQGSPSHFTFIVKIKKPEGSQIGMACQVSALFGVLKFTKPSCRELYGFSGTCCNFLSVTEISIISSVFVLGWYTTSLPIPKKKFINPSKLHEDVCDLVQSLPTMHLKHLIRLI